MLHCQTRWSWCRWGGCGGEGRGGVANGVRMVATWQGGGRGMTWVRAGRAAPGIPGLYHPVALVQEGTTALTVQYRSRALLLCAPCPGGHPPRSHCVAPPCCICDALPRASPRRTAYWRRRCTRRDGTTRSTWGSQVRWLGLMHALVMRPPPDVACRSSMSNANPRTRSPGIHRWRGLAVPPPVATRGAARWVAGASACGTSSASVGAMAARHAAAAAATGVEGAATPLAGTLGRGAAQRGMPLTPNWQRQARKLACRAAPPPSTRQRHTPTPHAHAHAQRRARARTGA